MPQWASWVVFILAFFSIYGGAHYYLYVWFVRTAEPPPKLRRVIKIILFLLVLSFPLARFLAKLDFNSFTHLVALITFIWMGLAFYYFLLALGCEIIRGILLFLPFVPPQLSRPSLTGRRLLVSIISLIVLFIGGYAFSEAQNIRLTRMEIPLRGLPQELDGFSIVQVTDVHYGMLNEDRMLSKVVDLVNELEPDLVVITGDLVDESVDHMEKMALPLSRLQSRQGVWAVTGNHEYYAGLERAISIMKKANIQVLRNEIKVLPGGLQLLGIDDPSGSRRIGNPVPDYEQLISRLDPRLPSILLFHQPIQFKVANPFGPGLQLSGHTHGGQLFPIIFISKLIYPLTPGLHKFGDSHLYVSRGVGTAGPPMRLGAPPELVFIRLKAK